MTEEINPEELMPLPGRLKAENPSPSTGEELEPSVEPPDKPREASEPKPVKIQPGVVEPGYFSTKVERYRR